ncbi:MAG: hypothetical protein DME26_08180, partial [Verrucomicrobia bacterium]
MKRPTLCLAVLLAATVPSVALRAAGDLSDCHVRDQASDTLASPVSALQSKLASGEANLQFEPAHGYLVSLLRLLHVPVSSQGLVFSKTSFQRQLINPQTPRALYFNDNVYVGWVPKGEVIEVSEVHPKKGAMFYTLSQ